jgi:hypothetical protein
MLHFSGDLQLAPTSLQNPVVTFSGILLAVLYHVSSLQSARIGLFTAQ